MTRKDYIRIARAISNSKPFSKNLTAEEQRELVANELAYELKQDNPNFDRQRFKKACGFE